MDEAGPNKWASFTLSSVKAGPPTGISCSSSSRGCCCCCCCVVGLWPFRLTQPAGRLALFTARHDHDGLPSEPVVNLRLQGRWEISRDRHQLPNRSEGPADSAFCLHFIPIWSLRSKHSRIIRSRHKGQPAEPHLLVQCKMRTNEM